MEGENRCLCMNIGWFFEYIKKLGVCLYPVQNVLAFVGFLDAR